MHLLGVSIENLRKEEVLGAIRRFLGEPKFHRIATVNPEFLVEADRNPAFRKSLRSADLRVADGFGIVLAGWLRGKRLHRFPGADLMDEILAKAERDGFGVFLVVRKDGLSSYEEVRHAILRRYPRLSVRGGSCEIADCRLQNAECGDKDFQSAISNHQSAILLCNFGAPEQELFLDSLKNDAGSIRLAMGIGGSLDYLTGKKRRAPGWMRAIGLEWLWRLMIQPKRFGRIWRATVVFLWKTAFR